MSPGLCSQPFVDDFGMSGEDADAIDWHFALARISGYVVLVQISKQASEPISLALSSVDVRIFRHEFITIFRFSHCDTLHPADVHIIEHIDDAATLYEEDSDTVFLAREVVERLQKITFADKRNEARRSLSMRRVSRPYW